MNRTRLLATIVCAAAVVFGCAVFAQRFTWPNGTGDDRNGAPDWENDPHFKDDVFTFVRIQYSSGGRRGRYRGGFGGYGGRFNGQFDDSFFGGRGRRRGRRGWGGWGGWATDFPDSDLNFSFRLQQLTSLKVNPEPVVLQLTDDRLFDYPFIYIVEPGGLMVLDEEVLALRKYLLSGGFLMVDDFWGADEWQNFYEQIKRVFPDREPVELPLQHEIFHNVYQLKEKPQIPSITAARQGKPWGITWEDHGEDSQTPHYRGIFDDKGRMMAIICHNTDLGDGWEREGEEEWYFSEFAEKRAYPMGINIVVYAMTH